MITVFDIVSFIIINRRGKAFEKWGPTALLQEICNGIKTHALCVCHDNFGLINGVALGKQSSGTVMHIVGIVTIKKGLIPLMMNKLRTLFPTVTTITGQRNGVLKSYKNLSHLNNLTKKA